MLSHIQSLALSRGSPTPSPSKSMSGWIAEMADACDAHDAVPAPPLSKASVPSSMPPASIEDAPTEPATSPRMMEVPVPRYVEELRLPTREMGPREEPERFVTNWMVNDGRWTAEEFDALLRKARQAFNNQDMEREIEDAVQREKEAHDRSVKEWEARIAAQELKDRHDIPRGPPPPGPSSMRVLPNVHAALRQSDPSMATQSQPVVKKAPPSTGRPMPSGFYSAGEPPRIGTPAQPPPPTTSRPGAAQGQCLNLPLAATSMTPSHPPRPPIGALPKHVSMEMSSSANKHPLEQPAQQGPPNKHVRPKAFPYGQLPPSQTSMAAPSAVDMSRQGTPCPKGPPAEYVPAPPEVTSMSASASAAVQEPYMTENGKFRKIRSVTDIDWRRPLHEQLEPNLKGGPRSSRTPADLYMLRAQIPKLTKHLFDGLFPADNTITAVQKNHRVHKIHMSEVAAWVLNATHWFNLLQQPMMIIVWCHNWEDTSKFQYLMQILQVHFDDYVPRYQIFMFDDSKIYGSIQQWQEPTTIWDGKPVLGFMAETFLDDLPVIGFKDFNPMWTFPTTSVNQCWEPMTFGMVPWHICENVDKQKSKETLSIQGL